MNIIKNKRIAIVGGGPGGLTLARLLQLKGVPNAFGIKVYERDINKDVRVQGATLDLHEDSGLKALQQAGLIREFEKNYRPGAEKMCILDKHANSLFDEHAIKTESSLDNTPRPEIDRGPLRKILLDSLEPGTIVWNSQFVSMRSIDEKWQLEFKNGTTATADIVIAADGANSKIRPYITSVRPFYVGMTAIEGSVYDAEMRAPRISKLLKGGKMFVLSDAKTLIVSAKGDDSLQFYIGFKADENWINDSAIDFTNNEQLADWFKKEFSDWDAIWLELFENAEPNFIPRPQYCMPVNKDWKALSNLTLLGDAAHLMPPYAGEGVNMAMLDALELSDCLTDPAFNNTQEAIAAYEKQMRSRASEIAKMTLEQTAIMHSDDGLNNILEMFEEMQL
jgi:2-polyprenyl-6-methoxyphenol hydroxylase-like FAD-dependent oxidoreductase